MSIKYNTAKAMSTLAKLYAEKDIRLIVDDGGPRTDGRVIYLPSLPREVTKEELETIRCYLDHEAGHIVADSFKGHRMDKIVREHGDKGGAILNALEDARIEHVMSTKFTGVDFSNMHDKWSSESLATFTQQLVHALYLNSRRGWGHHPDCEYVESLLLPLKRRIMGVHKRDTVLAVSNLAFDIAVILSGISAPTEKTFSNEEGQDSDDNSSESAGQSQDDGEDNGEAGGEGEAEGKAEGEAEGEGEGKGEGEAEGEAEAEAEGKGDSKAEGEGEGEGKGKGEDKGETEGQAEDGSSSGSGESAHQGDNQNGGDSDGSAAGGNGSMLDAVDEDDTSHKIKPVQSLPGEAITQQDFVGGGAFIAEKAHPSRMTMPGYSGGAREGSRVSRKISSVLSSQALQGVTTPRGSGSRVHRGSLAKFATQITTRVLVRDYETDAVNTDVAILVDHSGSLSSSQYAQEIHAAGALTRAIHMLGGNACVIGFGETVNVLKGLRDNPRADIEFPRKEGNTNTGSGILEAIAQLDKGSAKKKVIVVLTDGVPGYATNTKPHLYVSAKLPCGDTDWFHLGSPCMAAMKECYKRGITLIPVPFGDDIIEMRDDIESWMRFAERRPSLGNHISVFCDYMLNEGVFMATKDLSSCASNVCNQISKFNGDIGSYIRKWS